ncbi:hypothetical protein CCACVL1_29425 [Corchorus capsularis]|uniref:Eukaryotic translation initiation factor 5B n=1 Tax=Corchorus capsularis TaxID=210143 RepID=A0A1R3G1U1_COCAP|nr:hypothetical protein CCACVL1_29425 [Corchorus capsularis]
MSAFGALAMDSDGEVVDDSLKEEENDDHVVAKALKGKKKKSKAAKKGGNRFALDEFDDDGFGKLEEKNDEEEDAPSLSFSDKKKSSKSSKKSGRTFGGSAFDAIADEDDDDGEVVEEENKVDDDDDDDMVAKALKGKKKKSKGGKKAGNSFAAVALDELDDEAGEEVVEEESKLEDDDMVAKALTGEEVVEEENIDDDDMVVKALTGKKKKSKGGKKGGNLFAAVALDELDDEAGDKEDEKKEEEEDVPSFPFSDKKKKSSKSSKKGGNSFSAAFLEDENDGDAPVSESTSAMDDYDDASAIAFSGKKKKSSKKKGGTELQTEVLDVVEPEQPSLGASYIEADDSKTDSKSEEVAETSKNKKKKKKNKSGRTAQEEEDLDKILAELGEGPPVTQAAAPPPEEKVQVPSEAVIAADATGEKEGEEESVESAAAKKKKKKKEKEKEKKAAAAAAAAVEVKEANQEEIKTETSDAKKKDAKSKAADKKLPKHVREMQEALARRKEAEERKKREEEEKLRKEEEERRRQEELERQAEEARRRKKEREKEKLLKKKQEGKLLTGKQKEEARRREAMRNQILANAGLSLPTAEKESAPAKRPIYGTKKSKTAHHHANGAAATKPEEVQAKENQQEEQETKDEVDSVEEEKVDEVESNNREDKSVVAEAAEENGMEEEEEDDDGEWDEKSWDDVNLNIKGAFDDEEADSEPKPVVQKDIKNATPASRNAGGGAPAATKPTVEAKKATASQPIKSQSDESKKPHPEVEAPQKNIKKDTAAKNKAPKSDALPQKSEENLRSPICCIMGHVDTGKTKLLDCIRGTNVQEGEAGGITQQIGATYFPADNIRDRTKELKADAKLKVPGLLVIDTPGHESFTNLRSRGSGLCDIAILVVDIMHGLEPQTIESLNLLRMRNTEFIVALNKVDRLYGWKVSRNAPFVKSIKQQSRDVQTEFNTRLGQVVLQFKEQGLNTELYYKNREMGETFSIVPTSAITGEGIPDLLLLLVQWAQKTMVEKLTYNDEVQCTVLEVKVIEGLGTTIDVVLVNGVLHEGDQIVGPIVTTIRALLTPHPMKELRVKGTYMQHKEIKAAMGIKIAAQGLEHAVAGTGLYVVGPDDDLEEVKETVKEDMQSVMSRIDKSGEGVYVQASTLGSLEALLEFLKTPAVNIPVSGIGIGPVHKKDVMKASVMLEKKKEYATILAFDVKVTPEARELADELGVRIFIADIIYHLFDQFKAYIDGLKEERKKEAADEAVFPCVLKILPNCVFMKKDPIVLGVDILEGILRVGTPICVPQRDFIDIGRIASIENNHKPVDVAKKGQKVAIKIIGSNPEEQQKMFGRHFELEDELVSHISRRSIDILKANYRDDLSLEEWKLVQRLKATSCVLRAKKYVKRSRDFGGREEEKEEEAKANRSRKVHCEVEVISWRERRIKAEISVAADIDSVWNALTDYERLADFIPNLVCSGRIPCPHPGRIWLEQRGLQRALYWHIEARVVLDLQEIPNSSNGRELHFSMVDGDFKKFEGKWSVKSGTRSSTTILSYEVSVIPRFNFPAIFLERIIRSDLPVNLRALAGQAERKFAKDLVKTSSPGMDLDGALLEKDKLPPVGLRDSYANSNLGPPLPSSSEVNSSNWGAFGKTCRIDRPCIVDEVHFRRFDGLLENGGVHRGVVASITVKAPVREVWNVLTAYESLPEFVPNLAISKVLSRDNNKVRVLQEGCKGLLYMVLHARVVLDLHEQREQEISFKQVEGDFDSFEGRWLLEQLGSHHTLLKYSVDSKMRRDSLLSEAIMEEVIYEDLPSNLCAIRDYIEKRGTEISLETHEGQQSSFSSTNNETGYSDTAEQVLDSTSTNSPRQRPRVPGLQRDIEVLKSELLKFITEHGQDGFMPMRKQLRLHGRVDIEKAITRMGGFRRIASLMNLSLAYKQRKPKGYWDNLENLQEEITRFQRSWGMDPSFMPSRKSFERAGRYDIARALEKWGGLHEVSRLLSLKVRHPNRQPQTTAKEKQIENVASSVKEIEEKTPTKPYVSQNTQKWLSKLKHLDINWVE